MTVPSDAALRAIAHPARRTMLRLVWDTERQASDLADATGLTRPAASQHLKQLREAGLVTVRVDGPRRWYRLRVDPLAELDDWLAPYRWMWADRLDRLGDHLETMPDAPIAIEGDPDDR